MQLDKQLEGAFSSEADGGRIQTARWEGGGRC